MLWQRSKQYEGMPTDQYRATDEGKKWAAATQQWEQWMANSRKARSGAAQPKLDPWAGSTPLPPGRPLHPDPNPPVMRDNRWQGQTDRPVGGYPVPPSWQTPGGQSPVPPPSSRPIPPSPSTRGPTAGRSAALPKRGPGMHSPMPAGSPPSLLPFFEEVAQEFPGANKFQIGDMARGRKRDAEMELIDAREAEMAGRLQRDQQRQARYGQELAAREPTPAQRQAMADTQRQQARQQSQRLAQTKHAMGQASPRR